MSRLVAVFNCYIHYLEQVGFSPIIVEQKAIFTDHDISRAKAINLLSGEIRFAASYYVSTCEFGRYLFCFVAAVPIFYTVKEVVTIPNQEKLNEGLVITQNHLRRRRRSQYTNLGRDFLFVRNGSKVERDGDYYYKEAAATKLTEDAPPHLCTFELGVVNLCHFRPFAIWNWE